MITDLLANYSWPMSGEAQYVMPTWTGSENVYYDVNGSVVPAGEGVEFEIQVKSVCKQTLNNDTCVDISTWSDGFTFTV